jgi:hypothetical protein
MIIGVDPAKKTGLAVVNGGQLVWSKTVNAWSSTAVDVIKFEIPGPIEVVAIEDQYIVNKSVGIKLARTAGWIAGVLGQCDPVWVMAKSWQAGLLDVSVKAKRDEVKRAAREKAREIWGRKCPRSQDEVDAALIAYWVESTRA